MAALEYPSTLFSGPGQLTVPYTVAGLAQIPTLAALDQQIAGASGAERAGLQTFRDLVAEALAAIVPGLGSLTAAWGAQLAARYAPVVHHPDGQDFFPASMHDLLNFADGTLSARYFAASGSRPLSGQILPLLFENPEVTGATGLPNQPYVSKQPFAAVINTAPPVVGFPADPLGAGRLNLGPALSRLGPGRLAPTLYAEIKGLAGALRLNQAYAAAAAAGGQYAPLRNNRIHTDPLLSTTGLGEAAPASSELAVAVREPVMVVFHGFYPADDEAWRRPALLATNREFHHLAFGLLLPSPTDADAATAAQPGFLFSCEGPDNVRMYPLGHPALQLVDDQGKAGPTGTHAVLYYANMSPAGWKATFSAMVTHGQSAGAAAGEYLGAIGLGAAVGFAAGGPFGAAAGAAVVAVMEILYLLYALFCALTGICPGSSGSGSAASADTGQNTYTQS